MDSRDSEAPQRREKLVPALAVGAVAVVALAAAVMVKRVDDPAVSQKAVVARTSNGVVTAPPLTAPDTKRMGGPAACQSCGVVQMVVAVNEPGSATPRAYQMHIRMDDGSVRTVEQRGALAAGSRVRVEGDSVKPVS